MLVLSALGPTSMVWVQRAYGTMGTMTLLVSRLLRGARGELGRRGTKNWFDRARSSAGVLPTTRLLHGQWVRCGRTGHLRSFLLRRHAGANDESLARADAGSDSHNLDAPLPGAPKMSGDIGLHEHLWGRSPLSVRRGAEVAQRADRGDTHTHNNFTQLRAAWMRKTLLLLVWLIRVLALERKKLQ